MGRRVLVVESPASDRWSVTWEFDEPTEGILFDRRGIGYRHRLWTPGPGLRWVQEGRDEVLRPADGQARTSYSVTFATYDASEGRSPPLHIRFSDGSRLIFTSHLGVHALACSGARCDRRDLGEPRQWTFRTDPGRALRVLDRSAVGEIVWDEPAGDLRGTYVYAGNGEAVAADPLLLLTDARLAPWLAEETRRTLPVLFSFYREQTGIALDFRPLILLSQRPSPDPGLALRGRTLPALMQLEADGSAWGTASDAGRTLWLEFLAHESFHFWNGQLARRTGNPADEWFSEGSAMYAAALSLRHAGKLDEAGMRRRLERAARECPADLRGPLRSEGAGRGVYSCAQVVMLAIDGELASRGGFFGFTGALFARARARGAYTTDDVLAVLVERGASAAFLTELRGLLEQGLGDDPRATMARFLTRGGSGSRN